MLSCLLCSLNAANKNIGTDIMIVVDNTDSMMKNDEFKYCGKAIKEFVSRNPSSSITRIGLIKFGLNPTLISELVWANEPNNRDSIRQIADTELAKYDSSGTNIISAIELAIDELAQSKNKKAIILLSDGFLEAKDRKTKIILKEKAKDFLAKKKTKIPIFVIGISTQNNPEYTKFLNEIAGDPKRAVFPKNAKDIPDIVDSFYEQIYGYKLEKGTALFVSPLSAGTAKIDIPKDTKESIVTLTTEGNIDIEVIDITNPKGKKITSNTKRCEYTPKDDSISVRLFYPLHGTYEIKIKSDAVTQVRVRNLPIRYFPVYKMFLIALVIILLTIAAMYFLHLPPFYKKQVILGKIKVTKKDENETEYDIYNWDDLGLICETGKYINKGNITLATLTDNPQHSKIIIKAAYDNVGTFTGIQFIGDLPYGFPEILGHNSEAIYNDNNCEYKIAFSIT